MVLEHLELDPLLDLRIRAGEVPVPGQRTDSLRSPGPQRDRPDEVAQAAKLPLEEARFGWEH